MPVTVWKLQLIKKMCISKSPIRIHQIVNNLSSISQRVLHIGLRSSGCDVSSNSHIRPIPATDQQNHGLQIADKNQSYIISSIACGNDYKGIKNMNNELLDLQVCFERCVKALWFNQFESNVLHSSERRPWVLQACSQWSRGQRTGLQSMDTRAACRPGYKSFAIKPVRKR